MTAVLRSDIGEADFRRVRAAAAAFLASLDEAQRARTKFAVDDDEWRKWMNQSFYVRQGVSFHEMNDRQREAAYNLMRAGLSAKGLQLTRDIMRLNENLAEITNHREEHGEWRYHITVMGEPSATQPWGWQLDGQVGGPLMAGIGAQPGHAGHAGQAGLDP